MISQDPQDAIDCGDSWRREGNVTRHPASVMRTLGMVCVVAFVTLATGRAETAVAACATTNTVLCVQGNRFRVEIDWLGFGGDGGQARVVPQQTSDSGLFYFFGSNNWEILVKVLDACGANGNNRYWVFAASATTLQFNLTVTDTQNGAVRTYFNPLGTPAAAITDTEAFATCSTSQGRRAASKRG